MEALVIVVLVFLGGLAFWIFRMFSSAFNQPLAKGQRPSAPGAPTSMKEIIRQHQPKTEAEILERSEPRKAISLEVEKLEKPPLETNKPKYRSLEDLEPRRRTLEKLEPMGSSQEKILGESTAQREDIVRRRREKNIYQASDKKPVSVFTQILRNPVSARQAVVMAEILKRKF